MRSPSSAPRLESFARAAAKAAAGGGSIHAIAPGRVIAVGRCTYCSVWKGYKPLWWVWVAHSKHLVSMYAHVDDGTYGSCERCGAAIPEERLRARPWAALCIEDQRRADRG